MLKHQDSELTKSNEKTKKELQYFLANPISDINILYLRHTIHTLNFNISTS